MTRRAWTDIAESLARLRAQLNDHARRFPTQRAAHMERANGVALAARTICGVLRTRSKRFDARRFMRIASSTK